MCVHLPDDFDVSLTRAKLTRGMLDEWLKVQTEDEDYRSSYNFFHQFGLFLGIDRDITIDVIATASNRFLNTVSAVIAAPNAHLFGAARERLLYPRTDLARSKLDLLPA